MKSGILKKSVTENKKPKSGVVPYPFELSSVSLSDDPTVKKRAEEAKRFLEKAGLPDFGKFCKK